LESKIAEISISLSKTETPFR